MGFFSGLRRKVKKLIPKEVRPFIPYAAAMIPGFQGLGAIGGSFTKAALARGLTDDEADLKDVLRAGAFAAAPAALDSGIAGLTKYSGDTGKFKGLSKFLNTAGEGKDAKSFAESAKRFADPKGMDAVKVVGGLGAIDAGIKAAELNEDALAKYNREMAAQGINDKAGRRAAIRAIYEGTGTWDMDEVDGMLDTYGYRTGGRVGYAMGDFVDTDQIIEDVQDYTVPGIVGKAAQGIGNLVSNNRDKVDMIIDMLIKVTGPAGGAKELIEILIDRYGVDPEVAQRKIINRMSDANEGFGPQGLDGTPDDGYRRNIGIDSGAEDYYGETPAMPENLGDMGGNMDDMSGNDLMNRIRRQGMPEGRPIPMPELSPRDPNDPRMRPIPMPGPMGDEDGRTMEERFPGARYAMMYGGRAGYSEGSEGGIELTDERKKKNKDRRTAIEKTLYEDQEGGDISITDSVKNQILMGDDDYEEFDDSLTYAKKGYDMLYPELENQPIRELRLADGGSVEDKLIERVKELQDEGMDFASAMAQAMKEDMAENKARGGIMNGMGVNIQEQIDTPRGDMMVDENIEVAQDMDMPIQDLAEEFEITFGRPAESIDELKMYYQQKYGFNGDLSMMEGSERTMAAQGGLMSMGGNEMDLRGGGFVPMGKAERADDVPARLSKNEFVMTADAVRAAGGGSVQKGADLMYDQMKQLEGQA